MIWLAVFLAATLIISIIVADAVARASTPLSFAQGEGPGVRE